MTRSTENPKGETTYAKVSHLERRWDLAADRVVVDVDHPSLDGEFLEASRQLVVPKFDRLQVLEF